MSTKEFLFPGTGSRVAGRAVLLAIDDVSLPLKESLCHYLSKWSVRRVPEERIGQSALVRDLPEDLSHAHIGIP